MGLSWVYTQTTRPLHPPLLPPFHYHQRLYCARSKQLEKKNLEKKQHLSLYLESYSIPQFKGCFIPVLRSFTFMHYIKCGLNQVRRVAPRLRMLCYIEFFSFLVSIFLFFHSWKRKRLISSRKVKNN